MNKNSPRLKQVDKLFEKFSSSTPGCAVGVSKDGRIVHLAGYGMARIGSKVPVTSKTVFQIASCTKQLTGFCIQRLVFKGKLGLADDVRKYVPELPAYQRPITVAHLLHHTSGLKDYMELFAAKENGRYLSHTRAEILQMIFSQKRLNFLPGSKHKYSNSGYILLGLIIERLSNRGLAIHFQDEIFRPLKMAATSVRVTGREVPRHLAFGYNRHKKRIAIHRTGGFHWGGLGDGDVFSNVEDMLLWMKNQESGKVGGRKVFAAMERKGKLNSGKTVDYGSGLYLNTYKDRKAVGHGGGDPGFLSVTCRIPSMKLMVVCLSNSDYLEPKVFTLFKQIIDHFGDGRVNIGAEG